MVDAPVRTVSDVIAEFLACKPSDEAVLTYFIPPYLQARVEFLLVQNREDELTAEEELELDIFVRADDLMSMLKLKTRLRLRNYNE